SRLAEQGSLFDEREAGRRAALFQAFDGVRRAFGHGVLVSGRAPHLKGRLDQDRHGFELRTPSLPRLTIRRSPINAAASPGLRTAIYYVPDLDKAKTWYRTLLGIDPYFDQPFYVGFNVGGFELGLHPSGDHERPGQGGAIPYWGVERMTVAWPRALGLG